MDRPYSRDATKMDLEDHSVDCLIAMHNIHHFASPYRFFKECERILAPGGLILIQEINTSLATRVILRLMRHEGWSYDIDVFDPCSIVNDSEDPWSANCAVPELLFEHPSRFEKEFKTLKIERNIKTECLIFPLSGGGISKVKIPRLPYVLLRLVSKIDKVLTTLAPNLFAMGRQVVIRKEKCSL